MQLYSNTLGMNNSLGVKGSSGNFFGGFSVGYKTHADYLQGGGDYVPNSRFNELTFNTNTGYSGKIGTFKVFYDYFKQDLGMTVPDAVPLINERGPLKTAFSWVNSNGILMPPISLLIENFKQHWTFHLSK
jgi:iron complex outermembrane receptor protein